MTPQQLRTTNLIFLEHEKLKKEVPLLQKQIVNYKKLDSLAVKHDSIQNLQLKNLNNTVIKQDNKIKNLKRVQSFGIGAIIALIIGIICK